MKRGSKTQGEGRTPSEKTQVVFTTAEYRRERRQALKAQEVEWAARSGPVTVRRKDQEAEG